MLQSCWGKYWETHLIFWQICFKFWRRIFLSYFDKYFSYFQKYASGFDKYDFRSKEGDAANAAISLEKNRNVDKIWFIFSQICFVFSQICFIFSQIRFIFSQICFKVKEGNVEDAPKAEMLLKKNRNLDKDSKLCCCQYSNVSLP